MSYTPISKSIEIEKMLTRAIEFFEAEPHEGNREAFLIRESYIAKLTVLKSRYERRIKESKIGRIRFKKWMKQSCYERRMHLMATQSKH